MALDGRFYGVWMVGSKADGSMSLLWWVVQMVEPWWTGAVSKDRRTIDHQPVTHGW